MSSIPFGLFASVSPTTVKAVSPKLAVIPAAGKGARLGKAGKLKPKGFIELDGTRLIEFSLKKLGSLGVDRVILGTGHCAEAYEKFSKEWKYPTLFHVKNHRYNKNGNMHTVYVLKDSVKESVILLDSDIIYPVSALKKVMEDPHPNVILTTSTTRSGDEVYVEVDDQGNLAQLSKDPKKLKAVHSESVGIYKLSLECFQAMCAAYEKALKKDPEIKMEYEQGLINIVSEHPVFVLAMDFEKECPWTEIDTEEHYQRAKDYVLPLLKAQEKGGM